MADFCLDLWGVYGTAIVYLTSAFAVALFIGLALFSVGDNGGYLDNSGMFNDRPNKQAANGDEFYRACEQRPSKVNEVRRQQRKAAWKNQHRFTGREFIRGRMSERIEHDPIDDWWMIGGEG